MDRVLGVDGCPGGWIVAEVVEGRLHWHLAATAAQVLALADGDTVGVDMPLGLAADSARACDTAARAFLGPARSSVFPAPVRAVLDCDDHPSASATSRAARGVGLSIQSWHLVDKIRQWDAALTPAALLGDAPQVAEVHPEIAFRLMAGAATMSSKKTAAGRSERVRAAESWLPGAGDLLGAAPRPARPDDALDALACAWSARRVRAGTAEVFGDPTVRDARGLPMLIRA